MARIFPSNIEQHPRGELIIEENHPGFHSVYFVPPEVKLKEAGLTFRNPEDHKRYILDVNAQDDYVSIYPINTLSTHHDFLKPKYIKLESITLHRFGFGEGETEDNNGNTGGNAFRLCKGL